MLSRGFLLVVLCIGAAQGEETKWGEEVVLGLPVSAGYGHVKQDGTGRLWMLIRDSSAYATLCTWEGDEWKGLIFAERVNFECSERLMPGPDGTLWCPCSANNTRRYIQVRGLQYRCGKVPDAEFMNNKTFCGDDAGHGWATWGYIPELFIATPEERIQPVQIETELKSGGKNQLLFHALNPCAMCQPVLRDSLGRFWLKVRYGMFSQAAPVVIVDPKFDDARSPKGLSSDWARRFPFMILDASGEVVYKPEHCRFQDTVPGISSDYTLLVEPLDANTMWVGFPDSLWRVDVRTLDGVLDKDLALGMVVSPTDSPEASVGRASVKIDIPQSIVRDGDDWYLAATTNLFRLRNGAWKPLCGRTDDGKEVPLSRACPFAATRGLWVGAQADPGLWFVPRDDGPAIPIDWRRNLDAGGAIFRLADGRLLTGRDTLFTEAEVLDGAHKPAPCEFVKTESVLLQDSYGNIYALVKRVDAFLSLWDGEAWRKLPLPETAGQENAASYSTRRALAMDQWQRVWVMEDYTDPMRPCRVYDTAGGSWKSYDSYLDALTGQRDRVGFDSMDIDFKRCRPVYGPGEKIGIHNGDNTFYFDGVQWYRWNKDVVPGEHQYADRADFKDGRFRLLSDNNTWEYTEGVGWKAAGHPSVDADLHAPKEVSAPDYCVPRPVDRFAKDRFGIFWYVHDNRLYHAGYGRCLPVFDEDRISPFKDQGGVAWAVADRKGNVFVNYYRIPSATPPPVVEIRGHTVAGDRVKITVAGTADSGIQYVARIDGGEWRSPQSGPELAIGPITDGKHKVELFALNARLQPSPIPQTLEVAVGSGEDTVAAAVKQLQNGDGAAREVAVKSLVAKGKQSLGPLRELRKSAERELQWWVDAAIGQIEGKEGSN